MISDRAYFIGKEKNPPSSGRFYDDGGPEDNYQDELSDFDGDGSVCPLNASVTTPGSYRSSAPGGCLTVRFLSISFNGNAPGWQATVSGGLEPATPACFEMVDCGETFTDPRGSAPYQNGDYRVCYLCAEEGEATIDFQDLDLRSDNVLAFYDGYGTDCLITTRTGAGETYRFSASGGGCLTLILNAADNGGTTGNPWETSGNLEAVFTCGFVYTNSFYRFIPAGTTATIQFAADAGNNVL
ncbi:MAG: hypothetical protein WA952_03135 [Lewinella sp.]